ncbi:hypothetical protein ALP50_200113 [Pseudomonas syringae pv. spinaceae]|uniref:Uncharacterized protein n=1 Tax=Pseudomonas syringae pv. spinaceae TaxID=264459 RepID=A0A0Q0CJ34_PSESX|nr:hypothetical protein ALO94_200103 [Pseudomonas syringae pv. spinaceae]RMT21998.1 hypothetical protein ALP50_200113 [Pseudomonas syringae pv. spinaceae]
MENEAYLFEPHGSWVKMKLDSVLRLHLQSVVIYEKTRKRQVGDDCF